MLRSRPARGSSSPSLARQAPENPHCSRSSPGSSRPPEESCSSTAGLSTRCGSAQNPSAPVAPGSLRTATGQAHDRAPLLASLLARLERAYDFWREDGLGPLYGDVGARDFLRGRRVSVDGEPALVVHIREDGRLEIATDAGEVRTLESGEVRFAA